MKIYTNLVKNDMPMIRLATASVIDEMSKLVSKGEY